MVGYIVVVQCLYQGTSDIRIACFYITVGKAGNLEGSGTVAIAQCNLAFVSQVVRVSAQRSLLGYFFLLKSPESKGYRPGYDQQHPQHQSHQSPYPFSRLFGLPFRLTPQDWPQQGIVRNLKILPGIPHVLPQQAFVDQ